MQSLKEFEAQIPDISVLIPSLKDHHRTEEQRQESKSWQPRSTIFVAFSFSFGFWAAIVALGWWVLAA